MEAALNDPAWLGVLLPPRCGTRAVAGSWLALRLEFLALQEMKRLAGQARGQPGGAERQKRRK